MRNEGKETSQGARKEELEEVSNIGEERENAVTKEEDEGASRGEK